MQRLKAGGIPSLHLEVIWCLVPIDYRPVDGSKIFLKYIGHFALRQAVFLCWAAVAKSKWHIAALQLLRAASIEASCPSIVSCAADPRVAGSRGPRPPDH
jgi:hypothetical protein